MRPLSVESLPAAPDFVLGTSMIRGIPTPVVDAGALIGEVAQPIFTRFITLRTGQAPVALAVEGVLGTRELPPASFRRFPPLMREAGGGVVEMLALLDSELLSVLKLARSVTERTLRALQPGRQK
jgi:purine-binding chemotaxis protein CheW